MTLHDLNIFAPADLSKDNLDSKGEFLIKNLLFVLRNFHQIEIILKNRMENVPVCNAHATGAQEEH